MEERYERIIALPRHVSTARKQMDIADRAAQFAPYAALVGFGDVVNEAARITEDRVIRDEGEMEKIDRALAYIFSHRGTVKATFTYFVKDERKAGGRYITKTGFATKFDEINRKIFLSDESNFPIDDIVKIELI